MKNLSLSMSAYLHDTSTYLNFDLHVVVSNL